MNAEEYCKGKAGTYIPDLMEAYANKKVLEALEEEVPKAFNAGKSNGEMVDAGLERNEVEDYTNHILLHKYK